MWEFPGISLLYRVAKDVVTGVMKNRHRPSRAEAVRLREKWGPIFESKIAERRSQRLGRDVIIRDVKRVDDYPSTDDKKGIFAWFKAGLIGTYHRGIRVVLAWEEIGWDDAGQRCRYPPAATDKRTTAALVGSIRYENIESVNWEGDEFYGLPHIYCHFVEKKGQPYEKTVFCQHVEAERGDFFRELVDFDTARSR